MRVGSCFTMAGPSEQLCRRPTGVPLVDNNIRDRRHFQDYFRRVQARADEACTDYVLTYDAQRIVTMRSPFRDTARVEWGLPPFVSGH